MHQEGTAYVLHWRNERLPEFMPTLEEEYLLDTQTREASLWQTIHISAGRRDKISKGDIAGLFFKQGGLVKGELGIIEIKNDSAYVAVMQNKAARCAEALQNARLKKTKIRLQIV